MRYNLRAYSLDWVFRNDSAVSTSGLTHETKIKLESVRLTKAQINNDMNKRAKGAKTKPVTVGNENLVFKRSGCAHVWSSGRSERIVILESRPIAALKRAHTLRLWWSGADTMRAASGQRLDSRPSLSASESTIREKVAKTMQRLWKMSGKVRSSTRI